VVVVTGVVELIVVIGAGELVLVAVVAEIVVAVVVVVLVVEIWLVVEVVLDVVVPADLEQPTTMMVTSNAYKMRLRFTYSALPALSIV
jgi:hypothetical protein